MSLPRHPWTWAAPALAVLLMAGACSSSGPAGPQSDGTGIEPPVHAGTVVVPDYLASLKGDMPGRGSNGYDPPTESERQEFVSAVLRLPDAVSADSALDALGYDVVVAVSAATGDTLDIVRERLPIRHGWGTFVRDRSAQARASAVDVDHPLYDLYTPELGGAVFDGCRCRWLLMAGAHRYANPGEVSDMARSQSSVFQAVHEATAPGLRMTLSIHGFAGSGYSPPISESDAVIGTGLPVGGTGIPEAYALRDSLMSAGFRAGVAWADSGYTDLGGSVNPQGQYSNARLGPGHWIQMETETGVRRDEARRGRLAAAAAAWLRGLAGGS